MIWQGTARSGGEIDPERELELRMVAQARKGAAWALSALVARYQPAVMRYLVRLIGDAELARVLAEQVFVRMAKRLRGPHGGDHLRLWLLRSATELGLDVLRHPNRPLPPRLAAPRGPVALLDGRTSTSQSGMGRFVAALGAQMRASIAPRPAPRTQQFVWQAPDQSGGEGEAPPDGDGEREELLSPRDALRHRLVRAVLAELPYGDAQCLALHLVGGLNQNEVAQALGVIPPVAQRHMVQGLQLFGRRYEAALASLGLPEDLDAETEPAQEPEPPTLAELAPTVSLAPPDGGMDELDAASAELRDLMELALAAPSTDAAEAMMPAAPEHDSVLDEAEPVVVAAEPVVVAAEPVVVREMLAEPEAGPSEDVEAVAEVAETVVAAAADEALPGASPRVVPVLAAALSADATADEAEIAAAGDEPHDEPHDEPASAREELVAQAPVAPRVVPVVSPRGYAEPVARAEPIADPPETPVAAEPDVVADAEQDAPVPGEAPETLAPPVAPALAGGPTVDAPRVVPVLARMAGEGDTARPAVDEPAARGADVVAEALSPAAPAPVDAPLPDAEMNDDIVVVVEADPYPQQGAPVPRAPQERLRRVLSADGEAEDPGIDIVIWPDA